MFWGITLENTKRYSQVVSDNFHVSMAALEPRSSTGKGDQFISVMLEREKSEFLLCTLHKDKLIQQTLDLHFIQGEEITFFLNGDGVVHLTGYITGPDEMEDYDEDSESEESETEVDIKGGKRKAIELANKLKAKKTKFDTSSDLELIGSGLKAQADDSDDDSDEDFDEDDDDDSDESDSDDVKIESPKKAVQAVKGNMKGQQNQKNAQNSNQLAKSTPKQGGGKQQAKQLQAGGKNQQGGKQTPKAGGQQQTPKPQQQQQKQKQQQTPKQVNGGDKTLDNSESAKKKRKRNKKKKGDTSINSEISSSPSTPHKTPVMQQTPKPKPQKLQGGVQIVDLKVGEGKEAKQGALVNLYYTGRFQKNNKLFDSVKKGETPFKFRLGRGEVIKGWDVGVQGMKIGGKRRITIPAAQAYGSKGNEAIPPNSDLVFDVELQQVS